MIVRWTKKNVRCRRNVDSYRMIRNEVMCQSNLKCVLRQNAVYHRNLDRCNTKYFNVSEEFEIRRKQNVIYHRNLDRCNRKYVNVRGIWNTF